MAEIDHDTMLIQAAARTLMEASLHLVESDPHIWSTRPCATCKAVSSILGRSFGCQKKMEEKRNG